MYKVGFIGAGTAAKTLAINLNNKDYPVVAVSSRSLKSAQNLVDNINKLHAYSYNQQVADNADLVFITTPDDVIASVAAEAWNKPVTIKQEELRKGKYYVEIEIVG